MKTLLVPRSAYMAKQVSHQDYYAQFVTPEVDALVRRHIGASRIKASTDEHLNDIPLKLWDALDQYSAMRDCRSVLKEAGDTFSLSAVVCIAKAAARIIKGNTKYVLTYVNADGMRQLFGANQGHKFKATPKDAQSYLEAVKSNNSLSTLESVIGKTGVETLEVRPVECYESGDAKSIYFDL